MYSTNSQFMLRFEGENMDIRIDPVFAKKIFMHSQPMKHCSKLMIVESLDAVPIQKNHCKTKFFADNRRLQLKCKLNKLNLFPHEVRVLIYSGKIMTNILTSNN